MDKRIKPDSEERNVQPNERCRSNLHMTSSALSLVAIMLTIALFVRLETVVHETTMMDAKFTHEIQQVKDSLKGKDKSANKETYVANGLVNNNKIIRRSPVQINRSDPADLSDVRDGIKKYVNSIIVKSFCLTPGKVCLPGPPGQKGVQGPRGKRGQKGTKGRKGTQGIMGPPGEPGKQGMMGDPGAQGIKGQKGDAGSPGHPGPKGEPGESISTPGVTVSPTSVTVTENRTATFYCSAAGNPKPTVSWSKVSDSKMLKSHQDKLEVQNAQHRDSGKYVCSGTNVLGKDEKMVELFVEVPPRFTRVPDRAVAVREGSTAIVRCEAFGFPPPEIHWSKAFSQLPQRRSRVTNGTLQISQFSVQDIGSYQCKATNRLGSVITTTALHFQRPPVLDFKANFTNLGATGRLGPTSLGSHYSGKHHDGQVTLASGIQQWTVPYTGDYRIEAIGASGGYDTRSNSRQYRGRGARMMGTFRLTKGETIQILVGQEGGINIHSQSSGGGGGTFVVRGSNTSLIIAGGGGGIENAYSRHTECDASTTTSGRAGYRSWSGGSGGHGAQTADSSNSGGGGGGFYSSGRSSKQFGGTMGYGGEGGKGFTQGGVGGRARNNNVVGGFGGGGGAYGNGGGGGGGGGYSGGSSGDNENDSCGGGGGSYNAGKNQQNECCYNKAGHGQVTITLI